MLRSLIVKVCVKSVPPYLHKYLYARSTVPFHISMRLRECSVEKCWGGPENGGGAMQIPYWIWGGPSKFHIGFGGGHVNSAYVEKSP